jgi:serine/threonine protein kinase
VQPSGAVQARATDRIPPSTRIGDYVVLGELGIEDAGMVYEAHHVLLPRKVRLKVMHANAAWSRTAAMAVLREACLLEALSHPGIPRIYECGVLADKRPWTAFEMIDGASLAETLRGGTLSMVDVVTMLRDVADLLQHAHGRGVVHRQLTANAIVRTPDRTVGYAVASWDAALTLDTRSRVMIDTRDDVFALGVIAFRALTGQMPDVHTTAEAFPSAPVELAKLIDQMLATEPVVRPTSAEVRERAKWLATTLEPLLMDTGRWTPPHGLDDQIPRPPSDSGFAIRISRTRSS